MYKLVSDFKPAGDQGRAIKQLVDGINKGLKKQVLLGATGTGKTFTISNVIKDINKPVLVLAHNKTLAGQLYNEFKEFFPENRVEYFISYYDYYQPEAYVAHSDTYIEKDASINQEIDEMRHAATASILERKDVIVIASVSCIYGIGDPEDYKSRMITLRTKTEYGRDNLLSQLVDNYYVRNNIEFDRGTFRVRGDVVEILPTYRKDKAIRVEFFDDEIERIREFNIVSGEILRELKYISLFPASHFVTNTDKFEEAIRRIKNELAERLVKLKENNQLLEEQRLRQRTNYDLEMLQEMGTCQGVENYSRHLSLREEGETPYTLIDFFDDFLMVIDESHVTLPQVRGMYKGDRARKMSLVDHGFRLPSALDNRPLDFDEFEEKLEQVIYVSATPGPYELEHGEQIVEQIIRPTGLLDPYVEVRSSEGQIDDLISELKLRIKKKERTLITTLTIKMSEDLTDYLKEIGIKVAYLHSKIKSLERIEIIRDLRRGIYDCIVGINLLREGLDIPEVSLITILDADKEGFLRSERSLIQTIGRAARNSAGTVIMYANKLTNSMQIAIDETNRRRKIQDEYNKEHGIIPQTIEKAIPESIKITEEITEKYPSGKKMTKPQLEKMIKDLDKEMRKAARNLEFERAATLRDLILELKGDL
ncbi:excinuclease ABC subunit UvrB [Mycoplasmatota bacterium]|nr:excinuclease ABC subunit UvrB [Mycoplasmatota bacterium]